MCKAIGTRRKKRNLSYKEQTVAPKQKAIRMELKRISNVDVAEFMVKGVGK